MSNQESRLSTNLSRFAGHAAASAVGAAVVVVGYVALADQFVISYTLPASVEVAPAIPPLDKLGYDTRLLALGKVATTSAWYAAFLQGTTTASTTERRPLWPVHKTYPRDS